MIGGLLLMAIASASTGTTLYVSPSAKPGGDGSAGKPFARIEQALEAAAGKAGVRILLHGGTYHLTKPLQIGPQNDGLTLENAPKAKPVVSGGEPFRLREESGLWVGSLPKGRRFSSLYVNGERRFRPRLPKSGYFTVVDMVDKTPEAQGAGWGRARVKPGEVPADIAGTEAEFASIVWWSMSRLRIKSVDGDVVSFVDPLPDQPKWQAFMAEGRFFIDNAPGPIAPGEWRIDGNRVAYRPKPGETLAKSTVVAPLCDRLVLMEGCKGVSFKGITFRHTNWVLGRGGRSFPQAEADLAGAIQATDCTGLKFTGCEVSQIDGYAIELGKGCRECIVEKCTLKDLGAGGVMIGTQAYEEDESKVAGHNVVKDNLMVHGGRLHPAGEGVWIGHSPYNTIEHNEIVDFYYTGISVGWSWGYGKSNQHHNVIARNLIHNIGQYVLSDMGGIYLLGVAPGTVVKENLIYDINSFGYGGWAIYPDEGSSNLVIECNVCYDTKSPGYHQHYGKDNIVRDNVFAFGREAQIRRSREEEHHSFTFQRNIVYWTNAPLMDGTWTNGNFAFDGNIYWRTDGKPIDFAGLTLDQWREKGRDLKSVVEDPLFVDPEHGDFHLKANSPARKQYFGLFEKAMDAWPVAKRYKGTMPPAFPLK